MPVDDPHSPSNNRSICHCLLWLEKKVQMGLTAKARGVGDQVDVFDEGETEQSKELILKKDSEQRRALRPTDALRMAIRNSRAPILFRLAEARMKRLNRQYTKSLRERYRSSMKCSTRSIGKKPVEPRPASDMTVEVSIKAPSRTPSRDDQVCFQIRKDVIAGREAESASAMQRLTKSLRSKACLPKPTS